MIWLKSFGRAIGTAFGFGAMGGMLGAYINSFWSIVTGFLLGLPVGLATGLDPFAFLLWIGGLVFFCGSVGAVIGGLITALVMSLYGFFNGWRPQEPDFYLIFRTVIWGGWLCLLAGALTILGAIGIWNMMIGNGLGLPPILNREPYILLWLVCCFSIGSMAGAITPHFIERFIRAWGRIRKRRGAEPLSPEEPAG